MESSLASAIINGSLADADFFLRQGVSVNDYHLTLAVQSRNIIMTELLLMLTHDDPRCIMVMFQVAVTRHCHEITDYFLALNMVDMTPEDILFLAAEVGNNYLVRKFLSFAPDAWPYTQNNDLSMLLMQAVASGDLETVQLVVSVVTIDYIPCALKTAFMKDYRPIIEYLLTFNVNLKLDGYIMRAAHHGHLEWVKFLYSQGANILAVKSTRGANLSDYVSAKTFLHGHSTIKVAAAKTYVATYAELPNPETIPTDVMNLLIAAQA